MRLLLLLLLVAVQAAAQVPDSGRWQELRFSAEEVGQLSEEQYIEQTVSLAAAGQLDRDRVLLARVQRIAKGLIRVATTLRPEAAGW
jgi:hypothetical protein